MNFPCLGRSSAECGCLILSWVGRSHQDIETWRLTLGLPGFHKRRPITLGSHLFQALARA